MRIQALIVDDNDQNLYMLEKVLEGHGYRAATARNGLEALELARKNPPDIIVSDILMPVMDGFALCREWRKDEQLKHIPFIFYTATYTDPRDEALAISMGADRFVVKPIEPRAFIDIMEVVIRDHKTGRFNSPNEPAEEESVLYRLYNEALVRKLEAKMLETERLNRILKLDIEKRIQVESALTVSEAKYRHLVENAPAGIYEFDYRTGKIVSVNDVFCEVTGYTREEILQMNPMDMMDDASREVQMDRLKQAREGETPPSSVEYMVRTKDGRSIWTQVLVRYDYEYGKPVRSTAVVHDITERKKSEEKIRVTMGELEKANQEIRNLNSELKGMVEEQINEIREKDHTIILQARQALMGDMLVSIAHHWRQPLCAISLNVQNLFRRLGTGMPDAAYIQEKEKTLLDLTNNLSKTIDDFRNFFRPDQKKVRFPVSEPIAKIRSVIEASLNYHQIMLQSAIREDAVLMGYPGEYGQVLLNLIVNARDALIERESPHPTIRIEHIENQGSSVLTVSDNAGGIAAEVAGKIFTPYFSTKPGGTGLGLFMSRNIIEKNMDGRIDFRNTEAGAEFSVSVPIAGGTE